MLQSQAVAPRTLGLLKRLMQLPALEQFVLVGGTNLALRFGHRLSVDFDLFSNQPFNPELLYAEIREVMPDTEFLDSNPSMLFLFVEGVKTDFVRLPFPYIAPIDTIDGIRLASVPDIVAMKLSAISQRGVKKDFWDMAELLDHYSLGQMLAMFREKYGQRDVFYVLRSLIYFEDAEAQADLDLLKKTTWEQVKNKVQVAVRGYVQEQA